MKDPGSDFKCEDEGFYAHPRDCKKYFWCLEAAGLGIVPHQFTCPSGLYFNKAADSCDYSRNVHCSKTSSSSSTTTTTDWPTTTTSTSTSRSAPVSTRANPLYKSPSRTTQRTTTSAYEEPSTEQAELDQEDPRVIKELIDLIKKVGGVEELERQLNLQEDAASESGSKSDQRSTTQSSIISKSLYDKIKHRASVLKTRPNFNGASQPERSLEKTKEESNESSKSESKEKSKDGFKDKKPAAPRSTTSRTTAESRSTTAKATSATATEGSIFSKKYNTVSRLSRPAPAVLDDDDEDIESLPESDAVSIEKPKYTSIKRKPAVKPAVVAENDYNSELENISREVFVAPKSESESTKKYATINRSRRPQVQKIEEEDDDESNEDEADEIIRTRAPVIASTSSKPTSKYFNLSRRRVTTETPEIER